MEGVEDGDSDFGSLGDAVVEVPPLQAAEPTDPLGPDAEPVNMDSLSPPKPVVLDSGGKAKTGAGKIPGSWNYTPNECVAVAWAALAASELGTTDMEGLYGRVRDFYLPKATELARTGGWTDALSRASKKRKITPQMSFDCRRSYPQGMWNKATELRREVQMSIYPVYCAVTRENRSGWTQEDFIRETKIRYYRACKKMKPDEPLIGGVPIDWTTGAWEVFLRFGAVGSDDAWFKTETSPRTATAGASGSTHVNPVSREDVKNAKKEFAKARKKVTKATPSTTGEAKNGKVEGEVEEEVHSPVRDPLVNLVQGMQDKIVTAMDKNTDKLHDLVERITKDMEATQAINVAKLASKEKELASKGVDNRINALKTLLSIYPQGSQEWSNALVELEALANIPPRN
jgi:hypothetical protein